MREEIRPLHNETRRIQPRSTHSLSLVAADGGNNSPRFDPFLIHLVRVVDSKNHEYVLPEYAKPAADTFAQRLREKFQHMLAESIEMNFSGECDDRNHGIDSETEETEAESEPVDAKAAYGNRAIEKLRNNADFMEQIYGKGIPWGGILRLLTNELPEALDRKSDVAYYLVREALERIFGARNEAWHTFKQINRDGKSVTVVKSGKALKILIDEILC